MEKIENGVHDLTNEQYHSSSGVSRSGLMKLMQSPSHYHYEYFTKTERSEPTSAMVVGELVHCMVLEPCETMSRYYVAMPVNKRTKAGKEDWVNQQAQAVGKKVVTIEQNQTAMSIANAVIMHPISRSLLPDCVVEKSIYFTHQQTGLQCKVRPDAWNGSIVVDLKTTADASFRAFQSSAAKYGYFLQAAMIQQGLAAIGLSLEKFIFIAVEKEPPYAVGIFVLDNEALDYGVNQFNQLMKKLKNCKDANEWPGYGIQNLTLPAWTKYEEIEE